MFKGDDSRGTGLSDPSSSSELERMTAKPHVRLSKRQVLGLRGIRLPALALKTMRETGIYCDPSVSIEHQDLAKRYVLRGRESGGASGHIGAYCGFVDTSGDPLPWLTRVNSVGRNGIHAIVVATELVRIQIFRNGQTCDLLITRHKLTCKSGRTRPALENSILSQGIHGNLLLESQSRELQRRNETLPVFHTRSGEELPIPEIFHDAVSRTITGAHCSGCHHCHVTEPGTEPFASSPVEGRP
jgi:hypothetical protein